MPSKKSRKKNSKTEPPSGGKRKKKQRKAQTITLPYYRCSRCAEPIEPRYVQRIETIGVEHEDITIRYHCPCIPPDAFVYARYVLVPMGVAYLIGFTEGLEHVHEWGTGGWYYENPVPEWAVPDFHPDLEQVRAEMGSCVTIEDFFRLCGTRYEEPFEGGGDSSSA